MLTLDKNSMESETKISVKEFCEILSISEATAKNWIKLNKIQPEYTKENVPYFSKKYVKELVKNLRTDSSVILKSRRNKKFVKGSFFYRDYLSKNSKNTDIVAELLNYITLNNPELSVSEIKYIVADCAVQLLSQKKKYSSDIKQNFLNEYLNNNINLSVYTKLVDDLIDNKISAQKFIKNNPDIFKTNYIYETNEDILGLLYISLSNLGKRKAKGAYYTPTEIVKKMVLLTEFDKSLQKNILDPCCGSGNFLLHLSKNIPLENIYGNDIDETAIKIVRLNMAMKFDISDTNILYENFTCSDFLMSGCSKKFDYIIGNPPWGAEFSSDEAKNLRALYITATNKKIESYDVFIEKSLSCLKRGGYLSYVLPESILSVKNHEPVRKIIMQKNSITYLEFLGNIFDKVQCPSIILQLKYTGLPLSCLGMKVVERNKSFVIKKERVVTAEVFSFLADDNEYRIYEKIISNKNNVYLKDNSIFALGLVTGNNKKYLSESKNDNNEPILKGSDIEKFKIKTSDSYIEYIPKNFQQTAPIEYYRVNEKLIYKFVSKKLVFAYDNQQLLTLNSCNVLIPQIDGLDIKYILAILNSRIAQFVFEKKYASMKVLRSHIEAVPIPYCDKKNQTEIIETVDRILYEKGDFTELYEILENKIYKLYGLTSEEYSVIKNGL